MDKVKPVIKFIIRFLDETELEYVSYTSDRKSAIADFHNKAWLEIDGVFYNKSLVFSWRVADAEK